MQPLLHLWSLAIEEQFYIIFPLLCALIWNSRSGVRTLGMTIGFITLGSLTACLMVKDQAFRFYFPFTRFWELGVGILLSYAQNFGFWSSEVQSALKRNVLSFFGCGLLIVSFFFVSEQSFPGVETLLPTLGTVLILSASPKAIVNRTLAWGPFVFIGLISYSLYLWHWPLIAYINIIEPAHDAWVDGLALAVSFTIAVLVYRYVETPFRTLQFPHTKRRAVTFLIAGLMAVTGVGHVIRHGDGLPERSSVLFQKVMTQIEAVRGDWVDEEMFFKVNVEGATLQMTRKEKFPDILFVGDSHLQQYFLRIAKLAEERNLTIGILAYGGCWIVPGAESKKEICLRKTRDFELLLKNPKIRHVVLAQKWGDYLADEGTGWVYNKKGEPVRFEEGHWTTILKNLRNYFVGNDRTLHVILDAPWDESDEGSDFNPLRRISRLYFSNLKDEDFMAPLPKDPTWLLGNNSVRFVFERVATIIDPVSYVCPEGRCNLLHYKDDDHLRASYAEEKAVWIDSIFDEIE